MTAPDEVGTFRIYIVRKKDRKEWLERAKSGDETAKLCVVAAKNYIKAMPNEPSECCCCDTPFSSNDGPMAFIIAIPTKSDPKTVGADTGAICSECIKHDNKWLIDQGVRREGLSPTTARPGDKIH